MDTVRDDASDELPVDPEIAHRLITRQVEFGRYDLDNLKRFLQQTDFRADLCLVDGVNCPSHLVDALESTITEAAFHGKIVLLLYRQNDRIIGSKITLDHLCGGRLFWLMVSDT